MSSVLRIAKGLASAPVGFLAGRVQRIACGPQAVLDLEIKAVEDSLQRSMLFHRLRRAAADPNVAAVLLRIREAPGSWAACSDLRDAIAALRAAGRSVYAWSESPGNRELWIASACDRVFVPPVTDVGFVGLGVELTFFGTALARLGIEPDFEAAGAYKSFGEPFTRSYASPANQEAVEHLVRDLQAQMIADVALGRGLEVSTVEELVNRAPLPAEEALEAGLVDALLYPDQLDAWIEQHHVNPARRLPFENWARLDAAVDWSERVGAGDQVAVVHLQGPIVMDERGRAPSIAARKVVPLLQELRKDDQVGAVVLHINSPGGSVLASDLIWREVEQMQQIKPVVASFEDVAASGGYYLAAPAAEIVARPGTLTGSIGVFGGKLVAGEGMRRLGVHTQPVSAAPNANLFSASRPFTESQRQRFRGSLQRFYDGFVQRVATGRRRATDAIEPHCRGRVWTGRAALECGLVDRYGGLYEAIDRARALAGMQPGSWARRDIPTHKPPLFARFVERSLGGGWPGAHLARLLELVAGVVGPRLAPLLEVLVQHEGQPLAMLPYDVEIR